jgi:hypothetical protein
MSLLLAVEALIFVHYKPVLLNLMLYGALAL